MSRVQLALNVTDLDASVSFYERLFATPPAKRRPGYANFAIADPPLKLVLLEQPDAEGAINHLGIEVAAPGEVLAARDRLDDAGLNGRNEDAVTCCYAVQDKVWVDAPDGESWEVYTVLGDADELRPEDTGARAVAQGAACCG